MIDVLCLLAIGLGVCALAAALMVATTPRDERPPGPWPH